MLFKVINLPEHQSKKRIKMELAWLSKVKHVLKYENTEMQEKERL